MRTSLKTLALLYLLVVMACSRSESDTLKIWLNQAPITADPYRFDFSAHHRIQGPIYVRLFTTYKDAKLGPALAKAWTSSDSYRIWKISIRNDVKFEDGLLITPEHVALSLKRFIFLAKSNGSKNVLADRIVGLELLKSLKDQIKGISHDSDSIILKFSKPIENLPEILSFGLFSIIHPNDFDPISGEWLAGLSPKASGPYKFNSSGPGKYSIELRKDIPADLVAEKAFTILQFTWGADSRQSVDLAEGVDFERPISKQFEFKGKTGSDIAYLHVHSWYFEKSKLSNTDIRRCLRRRFYQELGRRGVKVTQSFLPLIHAGVSEVTDDKLDCGNVDLGGSTFKFKAPTSFADETFSTISDALVASIKAFSGQVDLRPEISSEDLQQLKFSKKEVAPKLDFLMRTTAFGNEDPRDTIQFMLTPEGIFLPDPTRELNQLVQDPAFPIQKFNELIMRDAVIWPILHYSRGFWVNAGRVSLSRYNHQLPLSEFQWMEMK